MLLPHPRFCANTAHHVCIHPVGAFTERPRTVEDAGPYKKNASIAHRVCTQPVGAFVRTPRTMYVPRYRRAGACSRRNPRRTNGRSVGRGRGTSWAPSPTENTPSPTHKCHPEERNKARRTDLRGCKKHPRWCVHAKPSSTIRKRAVEGASPYGVVRYRLCIIDQPLTSKKICKRCRNFAIGACFCSRFLL